MKRIIIATILIVALMIPSTTALAAEYIGWEQIRLALADGDGAEFIVEDSYDLVFYPPDWADWDEFSKVLYAANWVAYHMQYVPDGTGEVWTPSIDQYLEITPGFAGSGTGDCEDFSMLLCAILRFNIGVPANRVWVQAGMIAVPELAPSEDAPPIMAHAYVVYKAQRGGIWYIEPQWGGLPYRGSKPSVAHWYYSPREMFWGESAQLKFNDQWVKGGGPYRNLMR